MHLEKNLWPKFFEKNINNNKLSFKFKVPDNLHYLKGHFEQMPIVPGVVQLHWVVQLSKKHFNLEKAITSVNRVKFVNPILPNKDVMLTIELKSQENSINYSYEWENTRFSSGNIKYNNLTRFNDEI